MNSTILIAHPDKSWSQQASEFLQKYSYQTQLVQNGRECQLESYKKLFSTILLDWDLSQTSSLEVLKYFRLNIPRTRVIMTLPAHAPTLSHEKLRLLGLGGYLKYPFTLNQLKECLEGTSKLEEQQARVALSQEKPSEVPSVIKRDDGDFTEVDLKSVQVQNACIFDYYLKVAPGEYALFLHKGEFLKKKHLDKLESVSKIYFLSVERRRYINFVNQLASEFLADPKKAPEEKVSVLKEATDKYIQEVYCEGIDEKLIHQGKGICKNIYELTKKEPELNNILEMIESDQPQEFNHLFLCSFYSALIGKNLDWTSQKGIELICLGALLHDIGMANLPEEIRHGDRSNFNQEEKILYQSHTRLGEEMLDKMPIIPDQVRQIIAQHHEYVNGEGFPQKLKSSKIYPPAKVVNLANDFSNILLSKNLQPREALKSIIQDKKQTARYDPEVLKALVLSFKKS